jgi:glutathione S-transferase
MDWALVELIPAMRDAFVQLIRTPADRRDTKAIAASTRATAPLVAILDEHLRGRDYLCGDRLTMADIPAGCAIHRWLGIPVERTPRPNVEAWCERLRARPAAAEVLTLPVT